MNKFSKLINKIDGFYKKAQDSGVTGEDIVRHLNAFIDMFESDLNQSTKSLLNQVATNIKSKKADKESVDFLVDKLKEESSKGNERLSSNVKELVSKLNEFAKTLSNSNTSSSQSSGPDLLASVKSTISQIKNYVEKNIGSDQTPIAVGGERLKQFSVVRSMISGLTKTTGLAASKYSSEWMGVDKYTKLLKELDNLASYLQIKFGKEYKENLEHSMQLAITTSRLNLSQLSKKEKPAPLDLSPFENQQPQTDPGQRALDRVRPLT